MAFTRIERALLKDVLQLDNEVHVIHKFVRDKYAKRFPELESLVPNALEFLAVVKELGNDIATKGQNREALSQYLLPATVIVVSVTASTSQGEPLTASELDAIFEACDMAMQLTVSVFLCFGDAGSAERDVSFTGSESKADYIRGAAHEYDRPELVSARGLWLRRNAHGQGGRPARLVKNALVQFASAGRAEENACWILVYCRATSRRHVILDCLY